MDFDEMFDQWHAKLRKFDDKYEDIQFKKESDNSLDPEEEHFAEDYEEFEKLLKKAREFYDEEDELEEDMIDDINWKFKRLEKFMI